MQTLRPRYICAELDPELETMSTEPVDLNKGRFDLHFNWKGHRDDESATWRKTLDAVLYDNNMRPGVDAITSLPDLKKALTAPWRNSAGDELLTGQGSGYTIDFYVKRGAKLDGGQDMKHEDYSDSIHVMRGVGNNSIRTAVLAGVFVLVPDSPEGTFETASGGDAEVHYKIPFKLHGPPDSLSWA